jgi:hypothetical protein
LRQWPLRTAENLEIRPLALGDCRTFDPSPGALPHPQFDARDLGWIRTAASPADLRSGVATRPLSGDKEGVFLLSTSVFYGQNFRKLCRFVEVVGKNTVAIVKQVFVSLFEPDSLAQLLKRPSGTWMARLRCNGPDGGCNARYAFLAPQAILVCYPADQSL